MLGPSSYRDEIVVQKKHMNKVLLGTPLRIFGRIRCRCSPTRERRNRLFLESTYLRLKKLPAAFSLFPRWSPRQDRLERS